MRHRVLLFSPITSTGPALHTAAETKTTETVRSRWELLGHAEVPQIRQEAARLGPALGVKHIPMLGQESHARSAACPSTAGGQGGSSMGTPAARAASLGQGDTSVSWLRGCTRDNDPAERPTAREVATLFSSRTRLCLPAPLKPSQPRRGTAILQATLFSSVRQQMKTMEWLTRSWRTEWKCSDMAL